MHSTKEGEGGRGRGGGGRVWASVGQGKEKKGLLVIIKSSHTDFLPNLFPLGP